MSFTIVCFAGVAIEAVSDSSRYFVIRVVDDNGMWLFPTNFISENSEFSQK